MTGETYAPKGGTQGLRREAIGLREVLFQSITAMAPAAAIAASIPAGTAFAGGSLPLSVLIALVACLFTASCVGELARQLPAAGSTATYAAQGLHPTVGFLVGWGYVFVEALVPALLLLQLGFTTAGTLHQEWSGYPADLWWPWSLAGAVIIAMAGWFGVRASARFGTVLGVFEVLVFLVFAVMLISQAGGDNTLSVFGTSHTAEGYEGIGGVFAGSVYTVLAFAGFEAAAPLAEETKDPRRTVRRAVLGAALAIGLVYVVTTYAMAVYLGPDEFGKFGASGAASWDGVARASFGAFWVLVFFAVVNSTLANANACANVSTRTAFAFGRIGVFPAALARLHPRHRSPAVGVAVQFVVAVGACLGLGLAYDPVTAFLLLATVIVTVVIGVYIVTNLACAAYFLRRRRELLSPVRHLLFPLLGIAAFVPALLTAAGLPVFDFVTELTEPVSYAGPVVGVWMALGAVVLLVLLRRHPERVADTARVHLDEEADEETDAEATDRPESTSGPTGAESR
ncbi:APC family permease [Streptomyces sp. NBC_01304]|uniref:APC family permease n=1 Tax=Streptomyces sp. NBC_01304 TaxID=2903818 RepID=UPI003FA3A506|nr:APC family permease [Streptomyces sp. NBC_01304]